MYSTVLYVTRRIVLTAVLGAGLCGWPINAALAQADPLPSWNDGAVKKSITDFVARVTTQGSPDFVPVPERMATFDNDGTLWVEQPMYVQLAFVLERVKAMAPLHPEWKDSSPSRRCLRTT